MKTAARWMVVMVLGGAGMLHAQSFAPLVISKSLPANGTLVLDANVGEVRIVHGDTQKTIQMTIDTRGNQDEATMRSWVRRFDVAGDRASIDLKLPNHTDNHNGVTVTISLPAQTDLKLDLGVGQLTVNGIEGNKELHVGIGQLTVGVADGAKYNDVNMEAKLGDTKDAVFHQHSGGFFPETRHTSLQGSYKLHATVGIGDVSIVQE